MLLIALASACDDKPAPSAETSPSTATATPGATEAPPSGTSIRQGVLGAPIALDAQLLVVVLPAIQSEQGPSHLERIRVDQRGIAERKTVLDANAIVPGAYINSWRNVHHPASGSGGEVVVAALP